MPAYDGLICVNIRPTVTAPPAGNCSPRPGKLVCVEHHPAPVEPKFNAAGNSKYESNADMLDLVQPNQQFMRGIRGVHGA